jgi:ribA/ribD-fused uncharacterized protein
MPRTKKVAKKEESSSESEIDISAFTIPRKEPLMENPKIVAFWRPCDQYAYFGQWYESEFELTDLICRNLPDQIKELDLYNDRIDILHKLCRDQGVFTTAEKFMMMGKAALFRDQMAFNRMGQTDSPRDHKDLGRTVRNFVESEWNKYCQDIVKIGNYLKFSQNRKLKKYIRDTNNALLVEASPVDKIWGIGLKFDHPDVQHIDRWKGTNYLGECLMFVRSILQKFIL